MLASIANYQLTYLPPNPFDFPSSIPILLEKVFIYFCLVGFCEGRISFLSGISVRIHKRVGKIFSGQWNHVFLYLPVTKQMFHYHALSDNQINLTECRSFSFKMQHGKENFVSNIENALYIVLQHPGLLIV
jgi:hypothetical protein